MCDNIKLYLNVSVHLSLQNYGNYLTMSIQNCDRQFRKKLYQKNINKKKLKMVSRKYKYTGTAVCYSKEVVDK